MLYLRCCLSHPDVPGWSTGSCRLHVQWLRHHKERLHETGGGLCQQYIAGLTSLGGHEDTVDLLCQEFNPSLCVGERTVYIGIINSEQQVLQSCMYHLLYKG